MAEGNKFLLLDANEADKLFRKYQTTDRLAPPEKRELFSLDTAMLRVINDKNMTQEEKVKIYNSTLSKFQSVKDYIPSQPPPPPSSNSTTDQRSKTHSDYKPTTGIAKQFHKKANELLAFLRRSGKVNVTGTGELIVKGETLTGSNVSDLLNKAINVKAKIDKPLGWGRFMEVVVEENVPKSLLSKIIKTDDLKPTLSVKKTPKRSRIPISNDRLSLDTWSSHDLPTTTDGKKKRKTKR